MMPTEVAVVGAAVPETVKGIDGWGTPLEAGTPGVGIRPMPVPVEVWVGLGRIEPRPLVRPPITEPSRSSVLLEVGLLVGDTAGTLTGMVDEPVGVVVVSAAGIIIPRLSRRLPWEEVVVARAVDEIFESLSVGLAVELLFVAVAPRRLERPEPTESRRESLVVVAASEVAVLAAGLLALELALELEPVAAEVALVVVELPRPSRLETSEPTWFRRGSLEVALAVLDWTAVLVVAVGCAAETISVEVVRV
jgi:hypothetical protein